MPFPSQSLLFALNFFLHPSMLGSLVPSSRFVIHDVMAQVDWDRARVVVEYGPGVGTITRAALERLHPDATLVAIEMNCDFVQLLEDEIRDPRVRVVHGSALNVRKVLAELHLPSADYIISGIPFTNMPASARRNIVRESREALQAEGAMVVYQFTRTVLPYLESQFTSVRQNFQLWNILPTHTFYCTP
jgi:phospholipid N-methyltransferase